MPMTNEMVDIIVVAAVFGAIFVLIVPFVRFYQILGLYKRKLKLEIAEFERRARIPPPSERHSPGVCREAIDAARKLDQKTED